jgi:hypothetical protein
LGQAHNCGRVKSVNGCPTNVKMCGYIEITENNGFINSFDVKKFEDTKRVIRIRKWKKDRHTMAKRKRKNNDLQNIHITLKID